MKIYFIIKTGVEKTSGKNFDPLKMFFFLPPSIMPCNYVKKGNTQARKYKPIL